jgi:hypothetical protein
MSRSGTGFRPGHTPFVKEEVGLQNNFKVHKKVVDSVDFANMIPLLRSNVD